MRALLSIHTAYLMSVPDLAKVIRNLYGLIEARLAVYPRLLKLSGRLDLMLSHVSTNMNLDEEDLYTPITAYEEPESDEENEDDVDEDGNIVDDDDDEWNAALPRGGTALHQDDAALFDDEVGMSELEGAGDEDDEEEEEDDSDDSDDSDEE